MNGLRFFLTLNALFFAAFLFAQKDTTDMSFTGTKLDPYEEHTDSTGKFSYSGYIDTYYAYYTDTTNGAGYTKFPTGSARNNEFGLNTILFSAQYQTQKVRATATLFYGDVANSAWSNYLNAVQEAHCGVRLRKKIWFDAGYFRTHFGLESIQARENPTASIATTTFYEPYYLSGAKLTFDVSEKWTIQTGVFNGYNTFIETNRNKAITVSALFIPNKRFTHTLNVMSCDESIALNQQRFYANYIGVFKSRRNNVGVDLNVGSQQHSLLSDSTKSALFYSGLVVYKHRFTPELAAYARYEYFNDINEILTGPVLNANHQLVGLEIQGFTAGFEYKPISNSFVRIEGRYLHLHNNENIFYYNNQSTNVRWEFIVSTGIWF